MARIFFFIPYGSLEAEVNAFINTLKERGFPDDQITPIQGGIQLDITDFQFTFSSKTRIVGDILRYKELYFFGEKLVTLTYSQHKKALISIEIKSSLLQEVLQSKKITSDPDLKQALIKEALEAYKEASKSIKPGSPLPDPNEILGNALLSFRYKKDSTALRVNTDTLFPDFKAQISSPNIQLQLLMSEVVKANQHRLFCDRKKKSLIQSLFEKCKNTEKPTEEDIKIQARNFIMLALQRTCIGFSNTTGTGELIKKLINQPGYAELKALLFPYRHDGEAITYQNLRNITTKQHRDQDSNLFSAFNKNRLFALFNNNPEIEKLDFTLDYKEKNQDEFDYFT